MEIATILYQNLFTACKAMQNIPLLVKGFILYARDPSHQEAEEEGILNFTKMVDSLL